MIEHSPSGTHAMVDGCAADNLNDPDRLGELLVAALVRVGASVLQLVKQRFEPQGCTVVAILAESHASVHTYPEHGVYMIDVFTCGDLDASSAAFEVAGQLGGKFTMRTVLRGNEKPRSGAGLIVWDNCSSDNSAD